MRRILRWLVGLPVALVVVAFAVANRRWVTLSFDPFSQEVPAAALDMPLWVLFFAGMFVGLIVGWVASWLAQGRWRKAAREARAEATRLQVEVADLRGGAEKPVATDSTRDLIPLNGGIL